MQNLKIIIIGRSRDTVNYEKALQRMGAACLTTMNLGCLSGFDGLLLPGGGDIAPALFGQRNRGSRNIDVELDITQLQALDFFMKCRRPVLGICKGMQIINVCLGGTIIQDIKESGHHAWDNGDRIHPTHLAPDCFLSEIYGKDTILTNSAHHQAIGSLGRELQLIQAADDGIPEGISHVSLPILGVQWHPERQLSPDSSRELADGSLVFSYFLSLCG
ncbi:MAG: gamma-glutamyl-gamma-aminobutyrate hydrolase family protein [Lachnospiraceae bacterium]|nr:gamma-glutamyl-gamma-aminobutyrate hydrolase family protein [Lachnospiraceae bacterium]